jgi:hypothetical protein
MAALKKSHVRFAGRHGRNLRKMAVLEVRVPIVPPSVRRRRKELTSATVRSSIKLITGSSPHANCRKLQTACFNEWHG